MQVTDEANQAQATQVADSGLANFDRLPDSAFVRLPTVVSLFGDVSTVTIWRWSGSGQIPEPRRIGGVTLWNVGELRAALAAPKPGRRGKADKALAASLASRAAKGPQRIRPGEVQP